MNLKLCPFCEIKDSRKYQPEYRIDRENGWDDCHIVYCGYCEVEKRGSTKENAMENWNKRSDSLEIGKTYILNKIKLYKEKISFLEKQLILERD